MHMLVVTATVHRIKSNFKVQTRLCFWDTAKEVISTSKMRQEDWASRIPKPGLQEEQGVILFRWEITFSVVWRDFPWHLKVFDGIYIKKLRGPNIGLTPLRWTDPKQDTFN